MDGEAGEGGAGLTGAAAVLGAALRRRIEAFAALPVEAPALEKDARTCAALARAGELVTRLQALEDKATPPSPPRLAHPDNDDDPRGEPAGHDAADEGLEEMDMDDQPRSGRTDAELEAMRADLERRLEDIVGRLQTKGRPGWPGRGGAPGARGGVAAVGAPGPAPADG